MAQKVADLMWEMLANAGVKRCYGIVGDTLNAFASSLAPAGIKFVHMRHEEAGAFAAQGEALLLNRLTAVAGSCGPGSLHFINGLYEANRNRAPVILIASQVVRRELGFDFIQEVDFKAVFKGCSVFCEMVLMPEQARRLTVMACQAAITRRGVSVLILPVDVADSAAAEELPYRVHTNVPVIRPSDADLDEMARLLAEGSNITIYAGAGCAGAHDEIVQLAERLQAPVAHTSRGKDALEYDNPHNVGMTGVLGMESGYHAILNCDTLLLLGTNFAWSQFYPKRAAIIQVDNDPMRIGQRHPVELGVVGDIKDALTRLNKLVEKRPIQKKHTAWLAQIAEWLKKAVEFLTAKKVPEAKANAEFIMAHVLKTSRPGIHVQAAIQWQRISAGDWAAYAADVVARLEH